MENKSWSIARYKTLSGFCPFIEWLETLDLTTQARIEVRLDRVRLGNFGDTKSLGEGIYELRLHFGAGYRIYYAISGKKVILLLMGGAKKSQTKDIRTARRYWKSYQEEQKRG
ncbi:MAG: type II toxin-antitoxin system RelE/ParE family toxin [Cyanobacteria bacterium P01_A01_bin.83]